MPTSKKGTSKPKPGSVQPTQAVAKSNDAALFRDDTYEYKDNEFEQIRQCLGVYVGTGGASGAMHLVNEVVTNSIDELTNPNTVGTIILFLYNEKENLFIVEDDGRGIPLEKLYDVIAKKHFSTKFSREFNRYSGGQNGVGTTITAALSDMFDITCYRDGQMRSVHMAGKELIDDGFSHCKGDRHGTKVSFIPSQKYLGKFKLTIDDVEDYLRRLSYILPPKVKIQYTGIPVKGKERKHAYTRQGLAANVEYLSQTLEFPPIVLAIPEVCVPAQENDDEEEWFKLEFAFSYDRTLDLMVTNSFCNKVATKEGGTHETAVIQAISQFFVKQAKGLDPNSKYEVSSDDCKKGLIMVVNCDSSNPKFEGQHKSKVDNKNVITYGKKPIMDALAAFFDTNNGLLRKIVQYLRQISKIRQEAHKIKNVALKKATTFLDDAEMGKVFYNVSDRNYSGYKELIICEGDSALSAIGSARNTKCQAIYGIRGVVPNTFGMLTAKAVESGTFHGLVKVMGCDIGKNFSMQKLRWSIICIATDKDVDGDYITSLLCVFFACHMPEIITEGRLFKIVPPLYLLDQKSGLKRYYNGSEYLFDKKELASIYHKVIASNLEVAIVNPRTKSQMVKGAGDIEELSKKQLVELLDATSTYLAELKTLQARSFGIPEVLEYICYFRVVSAVAPNPQEAFDELMKKKFPELNYDAIHTSLNGSYNGENVGLIVDRLFWRMAEKMMKLIAECPAFYVLVRNRNAGKDDRAAGEWSLMTYGSFLQMAEDAYYVKTEQRYKGVGETDASIIFPSMMNPKTRRLIRITMKDVESAMETLELLHGSSAELREARRQMLKEADIHIDDIDN